MSFYVNTADTNLLRDIMLQSGKFFVYKWEFEGKGTMGTPGASAVITLTDPPTFANDAFNNMTLFLRDDNDILASVNIDDSIADTSVTVDTTAANKVSDEATAGSWTAATVYDMYVQGTKVFFGYSDQQVDFEEETIDFLSGEIPREIIRSDTLGIVAGFSGNARNFGQINFSEIYSMTTYGSQANQLQSHGGFTPAARANWTARLEFNNVKIKLNTVEFFKGTLFPNGAVNTSEEGYKITPYIFKASRDTLRDSGAVDMWRIIQSTV